MIKKFIISNDSLEEELELELEKPNLSGIIVRSVTGLGYANSDIPITELALSDINYYNHSVFQTRNIVFTLSFVKGVNVELKRQLIYKFFPSKVDIKITIHTTEQTVYIKGNVETLDPDIFNKDENIQISILCVNPYFITNEKKHEFYKAENFTFFSDNLVHNGLLYYLTPEIGGIDALKIIYPSGYLYFGNQERFYNPYNQDAIDNSIPEDTEISNVIEENVIKPRQKMLFDTNIDTFGIYILDKDDNVITDITSKCYVYGEYPSLSYGKNEFQVLAYSVQESENDLEYQTLEDVYIHTSGWEDELLTEPETHPTYFDSGTTYYEKGLKTITVNSGFSPEPDTSYWKWPRLLVLSFYDCPITQGENPPIERLIGNVIVNGTHFTSLEENISYSSTYLLVVRDVEKPDDNIRIGQKVTVGSFSHLPTDITKYSEFLVNPFYDGKNFIINNEKDFKEFLYKFVRYNEYAYPAEVDNKSAGFIERYYLSVKDGETKNVFTYGNCSENLISDLYWDNYKAGL